MLSTGYTCQLVMKFEFSRQIFKNSNFMKIRPQGAQLFHGNGQTDGHEEANS